MVRRCCVVNCKETDLSILSHRFPKPQAIASKWRNALGIEEISLVELQKGSFVVCTKHFKGTDYRNEVSNCLNTTSIPNLDDNSGNNERIATTKGKEKSKHLSQLKWHKDTGGTEKRTVFVAKIAEEVKQSPKRVSPIVKEFPNKRVKLEENFRNNSTVVVKNQAEANNSDEQIMTSNYASVPIENYEDHEGYDFDNSLHKINSKHRTKSQTSSAHISNSDVSSDEEKIPPCFRKEALEKVKMEVLNKVRRNIQRDQISTANVNKKILKDAETQADNDQKLQETNLKSHLNAITSIENIQEPPLILQDQSTMTEEREKFHQEVQVNLETPSTSKPTDKDDKMIKLLYPKYAGLSKMELVKILVEKDLKISSLEEKEKQLEGILTKMI